MWRILEDDSTTRAAVQQRYAEVSGNRPVPRGAACILSPHTGKIWNHVPIIAPESLQCPPTPCKPNTTYWSLAPVSKVRHRDGSIGHFPHIIERGKPGVIGVLASGKRFVNEASAMLEAVPQGEQACSWLVCDHRFLRRHGQRVWRLVPLRRYQSGPGADLRLRGRAAYCRGSRTGMRRVCTLPNRPARPGRRTLPT